MDLKGKTALVTGAGSGICHAFAEQLLQQGCNVVVADLALQPQAQKTIEKFPTGTPRAVFIKTDVTDWSQIHAAFDKALSEFGSLDIVCPGAGVFDTEKSSNFWHYSPSTPTSSYKTLDINLQHPIRCTQLAIDYFLKQGHKHGVVLCVSSYAAQAVGPLVPLYAASKAGLSHFVRCMAALEEMIGVKVMAVAPGTTKTGIMEQVGKGFYVDEEKGDEWILPEEMAGWMVKLVTEKEYQGGTVLEVGKSHTRRVEIVNDPGPDMTLKGMQMSGLDGPIQEMTGLIEKNFGK